MANTKLRRKAEQFQKEQLARLATLPIAELSKFPKIQELQAPGTLTSEKFTIERTKNERGGFEIAVVHFLTTTSESRPDLDFLGFGRIGVGPSKARYGFDVTPKGKIVWPTFEHDPDD